MPKWIRVRDTSTGHTFDVEASALAHRRGVELVNDTQRWPDVEGPQARPRPAKRFVNKDGTAGTPDDAGTTGAPLTPPQAESRRARRNSTPADPSADTSEGR